MQTTTWDRCYESGWKGLIVDEAFAHPAKYSYGLIFRIVRHGIEQGYWKRGDVIGDPFGGIGSGGIVCAYQGLFWCGVELESRFVELADQNFGLHVHAWMNLGEPLPVILKGDSRRFAEIMAWMAPTDGCDAIVTSPPFVDVLVNREKDGGTPGGQVRKDGSASAKNTSSERYGRTPGQIGNLPPGQLEGIVTSPPYAESVKGEHVETETAKDSRDKRQTEGGSLGQSQRHGGYGSSEGNIGNLKEGKLDGVVTSPPYEGTEVGQLGNYKGPGSLPDSCGDLFKASGGERGNYADSEGQIGRDSGNTYWQAMRAVYGQCHLALKPGGVMAVVIKDYVSKGKRVPLCDQTADLLASCGFEVFERTRAMLVKTESHPSLFGGAETKKTERKSFFRRLAEKKGSPPIDWEEILWARKVGGGGGDVDGVITSPPYGDDVIRKRDAGKDGFAQGTTQGEHSCDAYGQTEGQIANLPSGEPPKRDN